MNPNDVIDAYVVEVIRRVPGAERNDIGLELRSLLAEMLAERAAAQGRPADDAMVLALLREFGAPAEVAARYRPPPGLVVIPAEQTRGFAVASLAGIGLQWALTLPRVFVEGQPLAAWWLGAGLGALWWPGFLAMMALAAASVRHWGWFTPAWRPRTVDPERVDSDAMSFGLAWFAIGVTVMICLPWTAKLLPEPFPPIFAFDPGFLRTRAWPVLVLWLGSFATLAAMLFRGRWNALGRALEIVMALAWIALLGWWLAAGNIFLAKPTDEGAKAALGLLIVILIVVSAVDLAFRWRRWCIRIRPPGPG